MSGHETWARMCDDIQHRLIQSSPLTVPTARELRNQIFKYLSTARDERVLKTKLENIHQLLKVTQKEGKKIEIVGGKRNFKRLKEVPHFERVDGCWFDFSILIDETLRPAEIIGFDFEIRFPENSPTQFLRIDLNLPDHDNEQRGMRFHLHPSHDDLMVHSPPMSPLEILHLFLYGLSLPEKPRTFQ